MTVKERIIEYIKATNKSVNSFERGAGLSVGYLRQLRKEPSREKIKSIILAFPDINEDWLLSGEGEMLNSAQENADFKYSNDASNLSGSLVPLIHIDSVGGVYSKNQLTSGEQYVEGMVPFPNVRPDDVAIMQSGNSMSPTIPPGAILQIRKVENWREYFGYGGDFVLWLTDDRRITKQVQKCTADPKNYIVCHSYNPDIDDEELPKSMIREVWKVVNVLIKKGW